MQFNKYPEIEGMHSFLSPSGYHWINYSEEKLLSRYKTRQAAAHGTRLHEFAKECILLRQRLPRSTKTLNQYVNDAIGFGMSPEVMLFYSFNCFGTVDAIKYDERKNTLRVSDLKTGETETSFMQLYVYVAIFCLEYDIAPGTLDIELRIYQNDDCRIEIPDLETIIRIMDRIKTFDKIIELQKEKVIK